MWGRKKEPDDYCVAYAPNVYTNFPDVHVVHFTRIEDLWFHMLFLTSLAIHAYMATQHVRRAFKTTYFIMLQWLLKSHYAGYYIEEVLLTTK